VGADCRRESDGAQSQTCSCIGKFPQVSSAWKWNKGEQGRSAGATMHDANQELSH
jgi:hypothetical protein